MKTIQQPRLKSPNLIHVSPLTEKRLMDIGCGVDEIANEFHAQGAPECYLVAGIELKFLEIIKQYSQDMARNLKEFEEDTWKYLTKFVIFWTMMVRLLAAFPTYNIDGVEIEFAPSL